jgi:hypothetical protein
MISSTPGRSSSAWSSTQLRFRQWVLEFLARWRVAPGADYAAELRRLNALLARARGYREVVAADSGGASWNTPASTMSRSYSHCSRRKSPP